jgi:dTMP kinase
MPRGRFITLDGGEGAGKSTQLPLLVAALERAGINVVATREPGGSAGAETIRRLLLEGDNARWDARQEVLLLMAARRDHVMRLIEPALARGVWVVSDRFADSTLAYQGYGRGLALTDIAMLQRFAIGDFAPDLTLILDLPVELAHARTGLRSSPSDRFERLDAAFHGRLRHGFREIAAADANRCVLIDAAGSLEAVHRAIREAVIERLGVTPA